MSALAGMGATQVAEQIAITELRRHVARGTPLEERLRAAMRGAATHWMLEEAHASDGVRMRVAVTAVLAESDDDDEKRRTIETHRQLSIFSHFLDATAKGLRVETPEIEEIEGGPVPLLYLWREATGKKEHP